LFFLADASINAMVFLQAPFQTLGYRWRSPQGEERQAGSGNVVETNKVARQHVCTGGRERPCQNCWKTSHVMAGFEGRSTATAPEAPNAVRRLKTSNRKNNLTEIFSMSFGPLLVGSIPAFLAIHITPVFATLSKLLLLEAGATQERTLLGVGSWPS
jgi:hypothetical protein